MKPEYIDRPARYDGRKVKDYAVRKPCPCGNDTFWRGFDVNPNTGDSTRIWRCVNCGVETPRRKPVFS